MKEEEECNNALFHDENRARFKWVSSSGRVANFRCMKTLPFDLDPSIGRFFVITSMIICRDPRKQQNPRPENHLRSAQ